MSLSRLKVWISNDTLTASDLNAEFNNIINNPVSLISPLTASLDLNGNSLIIDTDGDMTLVEVADDIAQLTGNLRITGLTASRALATDANKQLTSSATTATELGYVNGVTSAIQTQIDTKFTDGSLTASRAVATTAGGALTVAATTSTELGYVNGVTSAIQTQIDTKITSGAGAIVDADINSSADIDSTKIKEASATNVVAIFDINGLLNGSFTTAAENFFLSGLTSSVQTQLNAKAATADILGKHTISVPAPSMMPQTTNGCAALAQVELTANQPELLVLDFDASADEWAIFQTKMPKSWDEGVIQYRVFWTSAGAVTTGVAWQLEAVSRADGEPFAAAYGTAVVVTDDAQGTANDIYVTAFSGDVTVSGAGADEWACFRIGRDVSDANDDMTQDARLIGVELTYTIDALNDD